MVSKKLSTNGTTFNVPVQLKFNSSASLNCPDAYCCFNPGASTSVYGSIILLPVVFCVVDIAVFAYLTPTVFALSCSAVTYLLFLSIAAAKSGLNGFATENPLNGSTRIPFLNLSNPYASISVLSVACFSR